MKKLRTVCLSLPIRLLWCIILLPAYIFSAHLRPHVVKKKKKKTACLNTARIHFPDTFSPGSIFANFFLTNIFYEICMNWICTPCTHEICTATVYLENSIIHGWSKRTHLESCKRSANTCLRNQWNRDIYSPAVPYVIAAPSRCTRADTTYFIILL